MKDKKMSRTFRNKNSMERFPIHVSLDTHTANTYAHGVDTRTGEIVIDKNILGGPQTCLKKLSGLGPKQNIMVVYEAGCLGYSPYRLFTKSGYQCKVIAPSSTPKRGKEQKTDREDAIKNLEYHLFGSLSYVQVPSPEDEDARELLRYRYGQVWKISKEKQRIQSLMRRQGMVYTATKTYWTVTHLRWLEKVALPPGSRLLLDMRLKTLALLQEDLSNLDRALDQIFSDNNQYKELMMIYRVLPGVGRVNGMTFILEGQDLGRFSNPAKLMNYTGLIPKKDSSGGKDPALRITKAGNKYLRMALVGTSKYYGDRRYLKGMKFIAALPLPLGNLLERCQDRLNYRYKHLRSKGKCSNKAKVAVARELCGFIWELAVKVKPLLQTMDTLSEAA